MVLPVALATKNHGWLFFLLDFGRESDRVIYVSNGGIRSSKSDTPGTREVSNQSLG